MMDLIDRQAAVNRIKKQIDLLEEDVPYMFSKEMVDNWNENAKRAKAYYENAIEMLERLPAADPVKHGKWIKTGYACGETEWSCSECGFSEWRTSNSCMKFCMNCGAKMDGEEV